MKIVFCLMDVSTIQFIICLGISCVKLLLVSLVSSVRLSDWNVVMKIMIHVPTKQNWNATKGYSATDLNKWSKEDLRFGR